MKKIAIDTLPLSSGHASRGMGVYARRLIENLEKEVKKEKNIKLDKVLLSKVNLKEYNLVHYPYFDLFYNSLPLTKQTRRVVTVPDATPLIYPEYYPMGVKGKMNFMLQSFALSNVDAVITISETSKKDIVRLLNYPAKKIFVTPLAANFNVKKSSDSELKKVKNKYKLPTEFILYIGDVNWNKNLIRLIEAVKMIDKKLVIVGKSAVKTEYDRNHKENEPLRIIQDKYGEDKSIMRLGFVEDEELNAIWQLATMYCFPSLYEGFGLSAAEAMDAGVPLACARTQALVELADDAAVYFDPYSASDIAEKISIVMKDKKLQKTLVDKGKKRIKNYTWQQTAKLTLDAYKKVLGAKQT